MDLTPAVVALRKDLPHRPERPGELRHSTLDSASLRARGWAPGFSLEEGLRETYEYIENQRAETPA